MLGEPERKVEDFMVTAEARVTYKIEIELRLDGARPVQLAVCSTVQIRSFPSLVRLGTIATFTKSHWAASVRCGGYNLNTCGPGVFERPVCREDIYYQHSMQANFPASL